MKQDLALLTTGTPCLTLGPCTERRNLLALVIFVITQNLSHLDGLDHLEILNLMKKSNPKQMIQILKISVKFEFEFLRFQFHSQ